MGNTYGTWLPGDPRGFRTRHHDGHVEGDYKSPPIKGRYDERHRKARDFQKRPSVYLTIAQRRRASEEMVGSLLRRKLELIVMSVDRVHFHALCRFPD
ncbi:MAG TPA: hypothetical protein VK986_21405, partial [Tepidisphaeraceae bacterium]|nr:hypothetical protein [Tepidisphaeraceae bacterium]